MKLSFRFKKKSNSTRIGLLLFSIFLSVLILIIPASGSTQTYLNPPNQIEPIVTIEPDVVEQTIDTSPEITEPIAQVHGQVVVEAQIAAHINVNLTVASNWNANVDPNNFTINMGPGERITPITVTVIAPLGIENDTKEIVSVAGTWTYFEGLPGGNIPPEQITLTARNTSADQPDNGNGDGDGGDGDDDAGFLPGFESVFMIAATSVVLLILILDRNRKL